MDTPTEIPLSPDSNEVARWIWRNLVPKSGQCSSIQGELLRAVEKLLWEAQNNGNINWGAHFEILIDFLEIILCNDPQISQDLKSSVRDDLAVLRDYESPCLEIELFDRLTEAVVTYCRLHPRLIPL